MTPELDRIAGTIGSVLYLLKTAPHQIVAIREALRDALQQLDTIAVSSGEK